MELFNRSVYTLLLLSLSLFQRSSTFLNGVTAFQPSQYHPQSLVQPTFSLADQLSNTGYSRQCSNHGTKGLLTTTMQQQQKRQLYSKASIVAFMVNPVEVIEVAAIGGFALLYYTVLTSGRNEYDDSYNDKAGTDKDSDEEAPKSSLAATTTLEKEPVKEPVTTPPVSVAQSAPSIKPLDDKVLDKKVENNAPEPAPSILQAGETVSDKKTKERMEDIAKVKEILMKKTSSAGSSVQDKAPVATVTSDSPVVVKPPVVPSSIDQKEQKPENRVLESKISTTSASAESRSVDSPDKVGLVQEKDRMAKEDDGDVSLMGPSTDQVEEKAPDVTTPTDDVSQDSPSSPPSSPSQQISQLSRKVAHTIDERKEQFQRSEESRANAEEKARRKAAWDSARQLSSPEEKVVQTSANEDSGSKSVDKSERPPRLRFARKLAKKIIRPWKKWGNL